jgi:hypothetical protein
MACAKFPSKNHSLATYCAFRNGRYLRIRMWLLVEVQIFVTLGVSWPAQSYVLLRCNVLWMI